MKVELKKPKTYINGNPYYAISAIKGILEQILGEKISISDARRIMVEYAKIRIISCANEDFYGTLYNKDDADWWFVTPSTQEKLKEFYRKIKEMKDAALNAATQPQKTKRTISLSSKTPDQIKKENDIKMAEIVKAQEEKERRSKEEDMEYVSDELLRNDGVYYKR